MHEIFFNSLSYGFLLDYFSSYVFPPLQCVLELLCDFFFNGTGWGGGASHSFHETLVQNFCLICYRVSE